MSCIFAVISDKNFHIYYTCEILNTLCLSPVVEPSESQQDHVQLSCFPSDVFQPRVTLGTCPVLFVCVSPMSQIHHHAFRLLQTLQIVPSCRTNTVQGSPEDDQYEYSNNSLPSQPQHIISQYIHMVLKFRIIQKLYHQYHQVHFVVTKILGMNYELHSSMTS